jgi:hypothetical protein
VTGSCEYGNKHSGYIKRWGIYWIAERLLASGGGLSLRRKYLGLNESANTGLNTLATLLFHFSEHIWKRWTVKMGWHPLFIKTLADRRTENPTPADLAIYLSAQHLCTSNCLSVTTVSSEKTEKIRSGEGGGCNGERGLPAIPANHLAYPATERAKTSHFSQFTTKQFRLLYSCEVWGSNGGEDVYVVFLGCNAVWTCR